MKIILYSVPPFFRTAYAKNTYNIAKRLRDRGFDVKIVANTGFDGSDPVIYKGLEVYPKIYYFNDDWSLHSLGYWCRLLNPDLVIQHFDLWVLGGMLHKVLPLGVKYATYTPIDQFPLIPYLVEDMKYAEINFAMSRFAEKVMREAGVPNVVYFPHGVDTKIYRPVDEVTRRRVRRIYGIEDEAFVFLHVGINYGIRKNISGLLRAFKKFIDQTKARPGEVYLILWTYPFRDVFNPNGEDLSVVWRYLGIGRYIKYPVRDVYWKGLSEEEMALFYNIADVFVTASMGEGFGLPILESMSCGKPVIGTNFSSIPELVEGCGDLARVSEYLGMRLTCGFQAIVDTDHLADLMVKYYNSPSLVEEKGKKCLEKAKQYDWDLVIDKYLIPSIEKVIG